jgi:predicted permease
MQASYDAEATRRLLDRMEQELESRPEVVAAGHSIMRMLDGDTWNNTVNVEGYERKQDERMAPNFNAVSPGFFRTLEIPLLEGRGFTAADLDGAPRVGVVNESFVKHFFPNESPLGRHFGFGEKPDIEIVGVVPDTRYEGVREDIPEQVFVPFAQSPWPTGAQVYVRTDRRPEDAVPAARAVARGLDASLPIVELRLMEDQKNSTLSVERLLAFLATAFGVLATILAAVGLYGLLAYSVARRKREIGLRIALGAQRGDVSWLVLKEVVWLFAIGAAAAIPAALVLGRWTESQLYGVSASDPLTMGAAVVGLSLVALAAGYLPARRAARTQPMEALRLE